MYVCYIDSPKGRKFFSKVLSFCTHYTLSVLPYEPLSTGSGSFLGARASRASPGISIVRTAIVVVRTPYTWSYVSVLLYQWDFGLGNRNRDMLPDLGGFRTTRSQKNSWNQCWAGIRTRVAWLTVWDSTHCATALLFYCRYIHHV